MLLSDFKTLARPYWTSSDRRTGLIIASSIAVLVAVDLGFNLWLSRFTKQVFDSVELHRQHALGQLAVLSLFVIAFGGIYFALTEFLRQLLEFRWRTKLTDYFVKKWLGGKSFYFIERDRSVDNPDQRIAEDIKLFAEHSMRLLVALALTISLFGLYSYILWINGPSMDVAGVRIYGYLFWIALIFGLVTNGFTHLAGRRLIGLTREQQKREANYRGTLTRQRESVEQIAAGEGQQFEQSRLAMTFATIAANWVSVIRTSFLLNFSSRSFYLYGGFIPVFAIAPQVFSGASTFGSMIQSQVAFNYVATAVAFFSSAYQEIVVLAATAGRLRELDTELDRTWQSQIERCTGDDGAICTQDLLLARPDGTTILDIGSIRIGDGEKWIVRGPSGAGKTTLVRAIAGLWINGSGQISSPRHGNMMLLTQRLYLPPGTLRAVLCYPFAPACYENAALLAALARCELEHLTPYLDREHVWANIFSAGEQQRLGFVRALLQCPRVLIADEMTGALDEAAERRLYTKLLHALCHSTIVVVTHRASVESLFEYSLTLSLNGKSRARPALSPLRDALPMS